MILMIISCSGKFIDYILAHVDVHPVWHDFTHHEFVARLGDGSLPLEAYKYYMVQDYLYLVGHKSMPYVIVDRPDHLGRFTLLEPMLSPDTRPKTRTTLLQ
jgi:hypothetical protein